MAARRFDDVTLACSRLSRRYHFRSEDWVCWVQAFKNSARPSRPRV